MATQKQIDANRRNALLSTGPNTPEGIERSKMNRMTHGLCAKSASLRTENPAKFAAYLGAWVDDFKPPTMARLALVEEAATAAWRKRRFVYAEAARFDERLDRCRDNARRRERAAVDRLADRLAERPFEAEEALRSTRAGTARLIAMWHALADSFDGPREWRDPAAQHARLFALMGRGPGDRRDDPEVAEAFELSWRLLLTNLDFVEPADGYFRFSKAEELAAVDRLHALIGRRVEALTEHWHALPDSSLAIDRSAEAEALQPTKEDMLALRYEAQCHREFHRALNDLTRLTKSGDDLVEAVVEEAPEATPSQDANDATPDASEASESELGSFGAGASEGDSAAPARPSCGARPPIPAPGGVDPGGMRKAS